MNNKKRELLWARIGKIGTVLGIIVALIGIYKYITESSPNLNAEIHYGELKLSPVHEEVLSELKEIINVEELKNSYFDKAQAIAKETKLQGSKIYPSGEIQEEFFINLSNNMIDIDNYIIEGFKEFTNSFDRYQSSMGRYLSYSRTKLFDHNGYWMVVLTNDGSKIAKGVSLQLPNAEYVEIKRPGQEATIASVKEVIELGNVKPKEKIEVYAWTSSEPYSNLKDDIKLVYEDGTGDVALFEPQSPFWHHLRSIFLSLLFFGGLAVLWKFADYLQAINVAKINRAQNEESDD